MVLLWFEVGCFVFFSFLGFSLGFLRDRGRLASRLGWAGPGPGAAGWAGLDSGAGRLTVGSDSVKT